MDIQITSFRSVALLLHSTTEPPRNAGMKPVAAQIQDHQATWDYGLIIMSSAGYVPCMNSDTTISGAWQRYDSAKIGERGTASARQHIIRVLQPTDSKTP